MCGTKTENFYHSKMANIPKQPPRCQLERMHFQNFEKFYRKLSCVVCYRSSFLEVFYKKAVLKWSAMEFYF